MGNCLAQVDQTRADARRVLLQPTSSATMISYETSTFQCPRESRRILCERCGVFLINQDPPKPRSTSQGSRTGGTDGLADCNLSPNEPFCTLDSGLWFAPHAVVFGSSSSLTCAPGRAGSHQGLLSPRGGTGTSQKLHCRCLIIYLVNFKLRLPYKPRGARQ